MTTAKLNESAVIEIRSTRGVESAKALSQKYGVTYRVIMNVRCGIGWKDVVPLTTAAHKKPRTAALRRPAIERFTDLFIPEPNSGCWLWIGFLNDTGYGGFQYRGAARKAHRFSYEYFRGPIPAGLELDHLCRVRCCVNPQHLEAVTRTVNISRSMCQSTLNAKKTHCKRGHELNKANVYNSNANQRTCRICRKFRRQRSKQAKILEVST